MNISYYQAESGVINEYSGIFLIYRGILMICHRKQTTGLILFDKEFIIVHKSIKSICFWQTVFDDLLYTIVAVLGFSNFSNNVVKRNKRTILY